MKKFVYLTLSLLWLAGCSYDSGRIRLFNYNLWSGSNPSSIVVSRGDTLYSISRKYDIPLRGLIETNGLRPPYSLYVGQSLRLPGAKYHVVSRGDTLYSISKKYSVDVNSLSRSNDIQPPYGLAVGQRLQLPDSVIGGDSSSSSYRTASTYSPPPKKTSSSFWGGSSSSSSASSSSSYTPPPKYRANKFAWPVKGPVLSAYGSIGKGRNNDGINIKAAKGSQVKAADKGTIAYAGNELKGFGNLILIRHDDGWVTAYAHNDKIFVKKGQKVTRGEKISTVGTSGGVSSPQLHFEIRQGKKAVNPQSYLN